MKRKLFILLPLTLLSALNSQLSTAHAQTTAFTYQGRLNNGGTPANGSYDLTFSLFDAGTNGNWIAGPITNTATAVTNGLFTVILDLSAAPFAGGASRWLQIEVRTNGSTGSYATLTPRQQITSTPYAITAVNFTGTLPATQLTGTLPSSLLSGAYSSALTFNSAENKLSGNGAGLASVNAATLDGYTACNLPCYWNLSGNAGTTAGLDFLGTTDNQPLELKVNGMRCLRLEFAGDSSKFPDGLPDGAPNVILGAPVNYVAAGVVGATIAGGGASNYVGVVASNSVAGDFSTVGGGGFNRIGIDSLNDVIAGGYFNEIANNAGISAIGGGFANSIGLLADGSAIAGGESNQINEYADRCFIGGGFQNVMSSSSRYASIGGGFNNTNGSQYGFIGGGQGNGTTNYYATVAGGFFNRSGDVATVGGGQMNTSSGYSATVGGGEQNLSTGYYATVGGGNENISSGMHSTIPGGDGNTAQGDWSFAAGRLAKAYHTGSFVWADSQPAGFSSTTNDQFSIRAGAGVWVNGNGGAELMRLDEQGRLHVGGPVAEFSLKNRNSADVHTQDPVNGERWVLYSRDEAGTGRLFIWSGGDKASVDPGGNMCATSFNPCSDRNTKQNFSPVDPAEVLDKVAALPITRWNFKHDADTAHIGPMAQDFYAAFGVGPDDKHIATVDADGVALAAIQGLNQKLEAQRVELKQKQTELAELKQRLERLETLLSGTSDKTSH